jgi:hypothetical protein
LMIASTFFIRRLPRFRLAPSDHFPIRGAM